ncbi:MAG: asparagine synthase (glutamine-hydrolyzing), partial [Gammaproteobacteria bacterium]
MLAALTHRGPDDAGTYSGQGAILGQRRLSIIDLAGGHQPIPNEDRTKWIICNGEIYNHRELRMHLERSGHAFLTHSDSEVVLHLYEELGQRCVEKLRGMFAFAIWDAEKKILFAARDHLGQKPFFYVETQNGLFFASEIKALLALDPSLAKLNFEALYQYLSLRIIASPLSMFSEVKKLSPGHSLTFSANSGLRIERYWELYYEPKFVGSEQDAIDELEEKLIECLKLHTVSDVPVGAFMSGGLDSTLVVAMLMKHVVDVPIQTFSVGLPYRQFDEAPYARMIADQYGTHHHEETITPSLLDTLPELTWHLDEPSDPLAVCSYLIAKIAREHVKVVLGGDGGDELFAGYDRYYGNMYADQYARIPAMVRRNVVNRVLNRLPDGNWYKSLPHRLKWLNQLSFLRGGQRYARSLGYFYFNEAGTRSVYGPAMERVLASFDPEASIRDYFENAHASEALDRMLYADSQVRLPDHSVMILDRMTMAHGLEARSPFMDHILVEFAARLPTSLKIKRRSLRYIEYQLAKRYLPRAVLNRPKQGFSVALPYMLRHEYSVLFRILLENAHLARDEILSQNAISRLVEEHEIG